MQFQTELKRDGEQMITTTKLRQTETLEAAASTQAGVVWTKLLISLNKLHPPLFSLHDSRSNNNFETKDPA